MLHQTKKLAREIARHLSERASEEFDNRKITPPRELKMFYDTTRYGWCLVIEGLPPSDFPMIFSDSWIDHLIREQAKMVLDILEDVRWQPSQI